MANAVCLDLFSGPQEVREWSTRERRHLASKGHSWLYRVEGYRPAVRWHHIIFGKSCMEAKQGSNSQKEYPLIWDIMGFVAQMAEASLIPSDLEPINTPEALLPHGCCSPDSLSKSHLQQPKHASSCLCQLSCPRLLEVSAQTRMGSQD